MKGRYRQAWKRIANRDREAIYKSMLKRSQELKANVGAAAAQPPTDEGNEVPEPTEE